MADLTMDPVAEAHDGRTGPVAGLRAAVREASTVLSSPRVIATCIVAAAVTGLFGVVQIDAGLQRERSAELAHVAELERALDTRTAANARIGFDVARLGAAIAERMAELESTEGLLR